MYNIKPTTHHPAMQVRLEKGLHFFYSKLLLVHVDVFSLQFLPTGVARTQELRRREDRKTQLTRRWLAQLIAAAVLPPISRVNPSARLAVRPTVARHVRVILRVVKHIQGHRPVGLRRDLPRTAHSRRVTDAVPSPGLWPGPT